MPVMATAPTIQYAHEGDLHIAYQVWGSGPLDLVLVWGLFSHCELFWEDPEMARFLEDLGRFARVVQFDKRGTGMSDAIAGVPTLEQRMDDVRIVMDAVGIERAALLGESEGGPMSCLFAATFPERVSHLILYAPLVSFVSQGDFTAGFEQAVWEQWLPAMVDTWGTGTMSALGLPSRMHEEFARDLACRFERMALSRGAFRDLMRANGLIDIRPVLPLIRVPTLVLHRLDDQLLSADHGRYMAAHITGARFIGLEGIDHYVGAGDTDAVARQVRQFLTGVTEEEPFPADRVLATVMFTDIVKSTESAVELGDRRWKRVLDDHDQLVATEVARARGRLVKTTGDGALATFDGPARALRCAQSIASNVRRLGLQVRAGVHSGEVELRGEDVGGIGVHIGARVAAAAEPGQVLASRTVVDLVVGSGIQFTDRGDFELKGVPGHWRLYAAID
jgi:class 3 adenylate cyclase